MKSITEKIRMFLHRQLLKFGGFIPDKSYLSLQYWLYMGTCINWKSPTTFTEKIQWLKINNRDTKLHKLVDKYDVKEYVASIIGEEYIISSYGVWNDANDIDFDSLPERFVLKCTHSSHASVICKDKSRLNIKTAIELLNAGLKTSPYKKYREWAYKDVEPRIIAEEFMENKGEDDLTDYKFYCFNGQAHYCQVIKDRSEKESIDFFDRHWELQEFIGLNPKAVHSSKTIKKPVEYSKMLEIADKLSVGFPFARIDLYDINDRIYFGEITFYPGAGMGCFNPEAWNKILGDMIELPDIA